MRWRVNQFAACCFVINYAYCQSIVSSSSQPPDISGTWEIVWIFNEIRGNVNQINPCEGPFPYQYRFQVDIMQDRKDAHTLLVCYHGYDCSGGAPWAYTATLQQASLDAVSNNCGFQRHSAPTADTQPTDGYSESPICTGNRACISGRTTEQDILPNCQYPAACPAGASLPATSRLFGGFQLPATTWAKLCHQFDFLEPSSGTYAVPRFAKAWRHMNETWAFVQDVQLCGCYPACAVCGNIAGGAGGVAVMDAQCMSDRGFSTGDCGLSMIGTTGGAVIFPESTTGRPQVPATGGVPAQPQTCWMYADIEGSKTRSRDQMLQDHPEWQ
mmetsp:Transcript_59769/g.159034  ORF Transcript_59769/g.159034 Transcript_59769/m.159034 type:complete len:328 (-) Transcript_59769:24-1007(-)